MKGVSTVVAAILILGLATTIISVLETYYLPSLATEAELKHMQNVQKCFFELAEAAKNENNTVVIPLGSGEIPFISLSSSGTLSIIPEEGWLNITLINATYIKRFELYGADGTFENVTSVSGIILMLENTSQDAIYSVELDSRNRIEIEVTYFGNFSSIRIRTFKESLLIFDYVVATVTPENFFSLDVLNPAYRFNEVLENTSLYSLTLNGNFYLLIDVLETKTCTLNFSTGFVRYSSANNFWLNQEFVFENGAIILRQHNSSLIKLYPFSINNGELMINVFRIVGEELSVSGNGVVALDITTNLSELRVHAQDVIIKLSTQFPDAWHEYFLRIGQAETADGDVLVKFGSREVTLRIHETKVDFV
jgi:hypothetical protein